MAELEKSYVNQYSSNVYRMAQQRGSRLRGLVSEEKMRGEVMYFERVKPTAAIRSNSKYDDSPMIHTVFDRRALRAYEYVWGDMVDWQDDLNLLIDPTSNITYVGALALGRVIDDIIIECAFSGSAYEGKNGDTPVAFPSSQQIAITAGGASSANCGMNIEKLIRAKSLFGKADIDLDDPENTLYMAVAQSQLDDLLRTTETTNADYNTVRALVQGKIDSFMGFKFIRLQRLKKTALDSGFSRCCVAWAKSGVKLAIPQEIAGNIAQRADKNFNWYSHMKMKCGAARIEDTKVVQIACLENE